MKHQYFGDVNDYRKYGLLRCLAEATGMRVGVCWMLTPPDGKGDGNKVTYLRRPDIWRRHDPALFDFLHKHTHLKKQRNITLLRKHDVIPGAAYFEEELSDDSVQRSVYFNHVYTSLSTADIIFFDPDNGLPVRSVECGRRNSSKYIYWNEVREIWDRGKSVMVYQHFPRASRRDYITKRSGELGDICDGGKISVFRTAHVLFLLATRVHIHPVVSLVEKRWAGQVHAGHHAKF